MSRLRTRLVVAAAATLASLSPAAAAQPFFDRFDGRWSGTGQVQRDVDPSPRSVKCTLTGQRNGPNKMSIAGTCRAAVIFTRKIGADLTFDPKSQRFTGSYTGSATGPAKLSGRLRGERLVLEITYAKPVYGDRKAVMTIANPGSRNFSMAVTDRVEGRDKQTSSLSFRRN
jgi:hypothetical protein